MSTAKRTGLVQRILIRLEGFGRLSQAIAVAYRHGSAESQETDRRSEIVKKPDVRQPESGVTECHVMTAVGRRCAYAAEC
jgi:hypothetical protein